VASVNGSIEIHGEQQVERLVWQHVWQHVASVKALLGAYNCAYMYKQESYAIAKMTARCAIYMSALKVVEYA